VEVVVVTNLLHQSKATWLQNTAHQAMTIHYVEHLKMTVSTVLRVMIASSQMTVMTKLKLEMATMK